MRCLIRRFDSKRLDYFTFFSKRYNPCNLVAWIYFYICTINEAVTIHIDKCLFSVSCDTTLSLQFTVGAILHS